MNINVVVSGPAKSWQGEDLWTVEICINGDTFSRSYLTEKAANDVAARVRQAISRPPSRTAQEEMNRCPCCGASPLEQVAIFKVMGDDLGLLRCVNCGIVKAINITMREPRRNVNATS